MENTGELFFHMICGAILFITAVLSLVIGISGVIMSVTVCRKQLTDEVVYEISEQSGELFVSGAYVAACLMAEPQYMICIRKEESVITIHMEENPMKALLAAELVPDGLYRISYEYGTYDEIVRMWVAKVVDG